MKAFQKLKIMLQRATVERERAVRVSEDVRHAKQRQKKRQKQKHKHQKTRIHLGHETKLCFYSKRVARPLVASLRRAAEHVVMLQMVML